MKKIIALAAVIALMGAVTVTASAHGGHHGGGHHGGGHHSAYCDQYGHYGCNGYCY